MIFQHTKIPNVLFDSLLPDLTEAELKILLVIIRQTYGWIDNCTGKRKTRDRITQSQFKAKTGLCSRIVSKTLKMLAERDLITIYDQNHHVLENSSDRRGKSILYYSVQLVHKMTSTSAQSDTKLVHKSAYNKRNYTKENITKGNELPIRQNSFNSIGEIIKQSKYQSLLRF